MRSRRSRNWSSVHRPDARSVLDVGCGTGAHLAWFAERYERAEGIEPSARMIEEATIARPGLLIFPGDMRTFRHADRFDVVTSLFSAIGYMTTVDDLHLAVRNMAAHLTEGGVLVVEGWVEPDAWEGSRASSQAVVGDEVVAARVVVSGRDGDVSTIDMHYLLATVDGVEHVEEVHRMGLFTADRVPRRVRGRRPALRAGRRPDRPRRPRRDLMIRRSLRTTDTRHAVAQRSGTPICLLRSCE